MDAPEPVAEPTLAEKVAFLCRPSTLAQGIDAPERRETHMSWVFLAGDRVYKLKKPVHFAYLDFSTLRRREVACRAELDLNRRLSRDVYLDVVPLMMGSRGLSFGADGVVVDWLVVMRRLDERTTLESRIHERSLERPQLLRLGEALSHFYRHAIRTHPASAEEWRQSIATNRRILHVPRLSMPAGLVRRVDRAQRLFLDRCSALLCRRPTVDGHGDLRPEHIFLGNEVRIIDALEFNARLRSVDPLDEIAFLTVECERLGSPGTGEVIRRQVVRTSRLDAPPELFHFYRCHRATLRARLAIAHLLEPSPRSPGKWPRLARSYLAIAARDAARIELLVGRNRPVRARRDRGAKRRC